MTSLLTIPSVPLPAPVELITAREASRANLAIHRSGAFHRVRAGVYAPADAWRALPPWQRYLTRVHAFALVDPHAIFCHESAAALLGLPVFGEPRDIHVFDPARTRSRRFGDVAVHTSWNPRLVQIGALNVTSPLHTTLDLIRTLPPAFALAVADAAGRCFAGVDASALRTLSVEQVNSRGRRQISWVTERTDPRAESVGESVSRAVIEWCGFPEPDLQTWFGFEGHRDRSDFFWPRYDTIGESDGWGKYGADPAQAVAALGREKRREDRLRRHIRGFARWDFAGALHVVPLRDALLAAGVPLIRPPQPAMLATLARNPRSLAQKPHPQRDGT